MLQRLAILLTMVCCSVSAKEFSQADREWWAFQPVVKPAVPSVGQGWAINEIDYFVARKLQVQNLSPAGSAARRTLIRRLSFDLTGLPPTPGQVSEFLSDRAPDAYEKLVDRLLDSPRYGERLATFWLERHHPARGPCGLWALWPPWRWCGWSVGPPAGLLKRIPLRFRIDPGWRVERHAWRRSTQTMSGAVWPKPLDG